MGTQKISVGKRKRGRKRRRKGGRKEEKEGSKSLSDVPKVLFPGNGRTLWSPHLPTCELFHHGFILTGLPAECSSLLTCGENRPTDSMWRWSVIHPTPFSSLRSVSWLGWGTRGNKGPRLNLYGANVLSSKASPVP